MYQHYAACLSITFLLSSCSVEIYSTKHLKFGRTPERTVPGEKAEKPIPGVDTCSQVFQQTGLVFPYVKHKLETMNKKKRVPVYQTVLSYIGQRQEVNNSPSMTVPGESYTIPELFEKARGGIPVESIINVREGEFADTDATHEDFAPEDDFDLADLHEMDTLSKAVIADALEKDAAHKKEKASPKATESDPEANGKVGGATLQKNENVQKSASKAEKEQSSD